jgi:hypothetical protein
VSVLGLYDHMRFDAPDLIDEDDDVPTWPAEALTVTAGVVWWSAAPDLSDDE